MEREIINKAKEMLTNADTGTNDCKHYNNGFMDGVEYAIKALHHPPVVGRSEQLSCVTCKFNTEFWDEDYPCANCCGFDKHQAT